MNMMLWSCLAVEYLNNHTSVENVLTYQHHPYHLESEGNDEHDMNLQSERDDMPQNIHFNDF